MSIAAQRDMASELAIVVEASQELRFGRDGKLFVEPSQAADEILDLRQTDRDITSIQEAHIQGLKALVAAEDFVLGSIDFAGRPKRSFSTMSLLRGAIEASSLAFWYLDPEIEAPKREARAKTAFNFAWNQMEGFIKASGSAGDFDVTLLDQLERPEGGGKHGGWVSDEHRQVKLAEAIGLDETIAKVAFKVVSNVAHVQKDARDQIVIGLRGDGEAELQTHPGIEWCYWYVGTLFAGAVTKAAAFFGWNTDHWFELVLPATDRLLLMRQRVQADRTSSTTQ